MLSPIEIDVSSLEPPEPMTEILSALSQLNACQYLKIIHRRQPYPLYEKLVENGYHFVVDEISSERFHIYICTAKNAPRLVLERN